MEVSLMNKQHFSTPTMPPRIPTPTSPATSQLMESNGKHEQNVDSKSKLNHIQKKKHLSSKNEAANCTKYCLADSSNISNKNSKSTSSSKGMNPNLTATNKAIPKGKALIEEDEGKQEQEKLNNQEGGVVTKQDNLTTGSSMYNPQQLMMGSTGGMGMGMGMGYGIGGMGMGFGGYGGYGMGPYSSYGMGMGGPLQGLNQFLFSFQSVIFSLGQAMQVLGMNTQALNQLYHQAISMIDQALSVLHELKTLETDDGELNEKEIKKRRRLKAIRWSIMLGVSYGGYTFVRRWLRKRREYKNFVARTSTNGMLMGQAQYNNNHYHQYQQLQQRLPHSSRSTEMHSNPRYSNIDGLNQGYYGSRYGIQGYEPSSYLHHQSYNSYY